MIIKDEELKRATDILSSMEVPNVYRQFFMYCELCDEVHLIKKGTKCAKHIKLCN